MNIEKLIQKYPRSLKDTIFKEIMHYEILESLFNIQEIKNTLIFQGGTALRLCYNNDRYSEDLNFVIHKDKEFNKDFMDIFRAVFCEKIIQKYNLEAEIFEPQKNDNLVQRWSAKIYLPNNNKKTKINIEIANIPSYSNHFKAVKNNYEEVMSKRIFVQVETLEEIFADKIIALSQRPYIKFRDLWDIEWLINQNIAIDYNLIDLKIKDYKCSHFSKDLEAKKIELANPKIEQNFLGEMSRFLDEEYFLQIKNIKFFHTIQKSIIDKINTILTYFSTKENAEFNDSKNNEKLNKKKQR